MMRILSVMISYFSNLGIPRSGEVLRATALATYADVPFEKSFGTIVTERIIDLIMLFSLIGLGFVLQGELLLEVIGNPSLDGMLIVWMVLAASVCFLSTRQLKRRICSRWFCHVCHQWRYWFISHSCGSGATGFCYSKSASTCFWLGDVDRANPNGRGLW